LIAPYEQLEDRLMKQAQAGAKMTPQQVNFERSDIPLWRTVNIDLQSAN